MRPAVVAILACAAVTTGCRGTGGPPEPGRPADSFEALARQSLATIDGRLQLSGLIAEVEVLRDEWGVPHIYAQNTDDLFFAQGFVVAQDRLWQMEIWRRTAEGRLAELVGREALPHDRLLRLLKYRGPFDDREWTSYHPEGKRIFTAYAAGVNAFIASVGDNLPVEFKLTGTKPARWTPEQLVLRARSGDSVSEARAELRLAQSIARLGLREADRRAPTVPRDELKVPAGLDVSIISDATIEALNGDLYGRVPRPELVAEYRHLPGASASIDMGTPELSPGSNNWAIGSKLTGTGTAIMVDDPHRQVTNPAHRYLIHLSAPGWNVAGAT
jgi:penicillin amidase